MCDAVLLESVQEWRRRVVHLRLLHNHHTLEVGVHAARTEVGADGDVGVVTRTLVLVVDATETLVEEVVETLVNVVCLTHDDRVAFYGRVADGSYCVDLEGSDQRSYTVVNMVLVQKHLLQLSFPKHCLNLLVYKPPCKNVHLEVYEVTHVYPK